MKLLNITRKPGKFWMENKTFKVTFILLNGSTRETKISCPNRLRITEKIGNAQWLSYPTENGGLVFLNRDQVKEIEIEEVKTDGPDKP